MTATWNQRGYNNLMDAECKVIWNVIKLEKKMKAKDLEIRIDCKIVVEMIESKQESMHEVGSNINSKERRDRKGNSQVSEDKNPVERRVTQAEEKVVRCENVQGCKREGRTTQKDRDKTHIGFLVENMYKILRDFRKWVIICANRCNNDRTHYLTKKTIVDMEIEP